MGENNIQKGKDIYVIKNDINNKLYVGQATSAYVRFGTHIRDSRYKPVSIIDKAIAKYGERHFYYQILEYQIENYDEMEQYWIKELNTINPNGYNIAIGGRGFGYGVDHPSSYIKTSEELDNITKDLINTKYTYSQIARKYHVTSGVVGAINRGENYYRSYLQYPIRECRISDEKFNRIVYSLKYEHDKTLTKIAQEFDINASTLSDINQGTELHRDWLDYPLRSGKVTNPLNNVYQEIILELNNLDVSISDIARRYDVSVGAVCAINDGRSHHQDNVSYPIRNCKQTKYGREKFSQDQILEIENDLMQNDLSIEQIADKFHCSKSAICNINNGKTKKYHNDKIKYPIRPMRKDSKQNSK